MGLNFIRRFIGLPFESQFLKHLEHGLRLGGEKALVLGADFYCDEDFPSLSHLAPFFDENYGNAGSYPRLLHLIEKAFGKEIAARLAYQNASAFLRCGF